MRSKKLFIIITLLALLITTYAQEDDHDHQEDDHQHQQDEDHHQLQLLNQSQIWGFGFLAGFAVSLIGFLAAILLLVFKKCCSDVTFKMIIKFLFSLACGALLGDAIIHILASSYANQELDSLIISAIVICSILVFLILQRVLQSCGAAHHHWIDEQQSKVDILQNSNQRRSSVKVKQFKDNLSGQKIRSKEQIQQQQVQTQTGRCAKCCKQYAGKGSTGYVNLIGSLIHNFIDGLAVGIAFATGNPQQFIPVLIAIIVHQIPRELGDVAVLLKSNFSEIQTVICNGTINLISIVGVLIGLAVVNLHEAVKAYIMVFVAGNFLYIGADIWRNIFKNKGQNKVCKNILEFVGFGVGVGAMFALTQLEGDGHDH